LANADYARVVQSIRNKCDSREFVVSDFLPGSDWTGTEFQPLYIACGQSKQQAGFFFGLIVWQLMMADTQPWFFLPVAKGEDEVLKMRYSRKQDG